MSKTIFNSLVELAQERASAKPNENLYTFISDEQDKQYRLTYLGLERNAKKIAGMLQSIGNKGDRIVIFCNPGLDYIASFFGCLYGGMIAVPAYPPKFKRNYQKILKLFVNSGATTVLISSSILAAIQRDIEKDEFFQKINWIDVSMIPSNKLNYWTLPEMDRDDIAFLQYTSGSTSDPKGVMVTHGNLLTNLQVIYEKFGESKNSKGVIWLPPYHDMGLIGGILEPLYGGFETYLMSPFTFVQNPFIWLDTISRYRATTSGGPNFAYELCVQRITEEQRATLDLSSWELAFNGAEPVRQSTMDQFSDTFRSCGFRKEAFYTCYGLAEATLLVTGIQKEKAPVHCYVDEEELKQNRVVLAISGQGKQLVGNGSVFEGENLLVVDPVTCEVCLPDQVGELWISSPCVAKGYWNQQDVSQKTFRAFTNGSGPFLRTGDLGFVKNNELYITGRYKDLIIIRGRNYYPQDIEFLIEKSHEAFAPNSGTAFSIETDQEEKLIIVFEIKKGYMTADFDVIYRLARKALLDHYDLQIGTLVFIRPMSLPKTSSGKVQRNLCREKYLNHELNVIREIIQEKNETVIPWQDEWKEDTEVTDILNAFEERKENGDELCLGLLQQYLAGQAVSILKIDSESLYRDQPLNQYGFDSLMAVQYVHQIETDLKISISLELILGGENIAQLSKHILNELVLASGKNAKHRDLPEDKTNPYFPLSHNQRSLFFMDRLIREGAVYNLAFAVRFLTTVNLELLQASFQKMMQDNPSLRTTFMFHEKEAVQMIHEQMKVDFKVIDVSGRKAAEYKRIKRVESMKPFDLEKGPLFRIIIFREAEDDCHMLMVIHHLITDFWSLTLMIRQLGTLYAKIAANPEYVKESQAALSNYLKFVRWQEERIAARPELSEYWGRQLGGELPVLNLNTDYKRQAVQTYAGASEFIQLDDNMTGKIKKLCTKNGVTVYMLLLAAYQILLHKYSGQDDILVGSLTSGRQSADFSEVMGYFINPIVLRADLSEDPAFTAFLKQVKNTVLEAFEHQEYPFERLAEQLKIPRGLSRTPVFQVMFVYQSSPDQGLKELNAFALNETKAAIRTGGLSIELEPMSSQAAQYDLTLTAAELTEGIGLSMQYNTDLFEPDTITSMLRSLKKLLSSIVEYPAGKLSQLQIHTETERKVMLDSWNNTLAEYGDDCLHQLFEKQSVISPDSIAVSFRKTAVTYRELEQKSNFVAGYLHGLGLKKEGPVALCMERSIEMVIGLFGILKAGGYYIPLDPSHPKDRLNFIIEDVKKGSSRPMILTQAKLLPIFTDYEGEKICIDEDWQFIEKEEAGRPDVTVDQTQLAYTIYTSGSTGKPKGVQITHKAAVNFMESMKRQPGITERDTVLSVTTISFDIAALEIYLPLCCGAKVVIAEESVILDGSKLSKAMEESGITIMQGTPAIWRMLLEAGWSGRKELKVLCGGEAFPFELADRLLPKTKEVWNMYGPTETTIWSTIYKIEKTMNPIPIGRPINNTRIYILDRDLNPVPRGVSGELYIGGDGVARGYFNRDELTAERFMKDPFCNENLQGTRMYRTGDLVRYLKDGNLEYLGRLDHQVKVRGYRIETGEIEAILNTHPMVKTSLVIAKENKAGMNLLIAYLILNGEETYNVSELHRFLKEKLPDYMVPSHFIQMQAFPQTANGKLDRKLLPDPEYSRPAVENAYVKPQSQMEKQIDDIWRAVLELDKIGIHDNFFELGGNSMLMVQIQQRLLTIFPEREIGIVELFQYPTIASFADYLSGNGMKEMNRDAVMEEHIEARKEKALEAGLRREQRKKGRRLL